MGINYSFIDSQVYGTDDVNGIVSCLVGAGVAPFLARDSYNVSDLNVLTSAIAEPGVELDGCKCTGVYLDSAFAGVQVGQGIVYFESGVRLQVDSEGYNIPAGNISKGYVFAYYSPSLQTADIKFESELPTDGEYVLLARVDGDGKVWDERVFARSKIATLGSNLIIKKKFEAVEPMLVDTEDSYKWYIVAEIDGVNLSRHDYIMVNRANDNFFGYVFYDIKADKVLVSMESPVQGSSTVPSSGCIYSFNYDLFCYFKIMDGKPVVVARCRPGYESYIPSADFEAKIM